MSPSPMTAQTIVVAIAAVALVFGVLAMSRSSGGRPQTAEAGLISIALVALVVQAAVAPSRWGLRGSSGPSPGRERFADTATTATTTTATAPPAGIFPTASVATAPLTSTTTPAIPQGPRPSAPPRIVPTAPASPTWVPSMSSTTWEPREEGAISTIPSGLQTYVTALDSRSYAVTDSGRTWKNVAPVLQPSPKTAAASIIPWRQPDPTCAASAAGDRDFHFRSAPTYSRPAGFPLGDTVISGPMSHQLGVDGSQSFSVIALFQPTGSAPPSAAAPAVVFQMFANTPNNNGFALTIASSSAPPTSAPIAVATATPPSTTAPATATPTAAAVAMLTTAPQAAPTYAISLQVGADAPATAAAPLTLDPAHRYLIVAVKDRTAYRATVVDVDAKTFTSQPVLSGTMVSGGGNGTLRLANVESVVNSGANWAATLVALGIFSRALGDADVGALYSHYVAALGEYDQSRAALRRAQADAAAATACPYDDATCAACGGVADWSASSDAVFSASGPGGSACRAAIHGYCSATPSAQRCNCWDTANPSYGGSCAPYRSMFSGVPLVDPATCGGGRGDGGDPNESRGGDDDGQRHGQPPHRGNDVHDAGEALGASHLSPANVEAMAKLIGAIRQSDGDSGSCHPHHPTCHAKHPPPPPKPQHHGGDVCHPHHPKHHKCGQKDGDNDTDDGHNGNNSGGFWAWFTAPFRGSSEDTD